MVGIVWQTCLTALPIFIVLRSWDWIVATLITLIVTTVFIKFNWYDKLPTAEAAEFLEVSEVTSCTLRSHHWFALLQSACAIVVTFASHSAISGRRGAAKLHHRAAAISSSTATKPYRFISFNIPNLLVIEDAFEFTSTSPWRWPDEYEIDDASNRSGKWAGRSCGPT